MHKLLVCLMIGVLVHAVGCGESTTSPAQQTSSTEQSSAPPTDPVAGVAYDFFSAVLASDKDGARAKLTPIAVQRMNELGMDFLLPVSESSKFTVGQAEIIEEGMAAVDTILTETDSTTGEVVREEITVVLRQNNGSWGVMGVVTGMGANEQLDGFNFEKPDQPFDAETFADSEPTGPPALQQATRPPSAQDPFRQ